MQILLSDEAYADIDFIFSSVSRRSVLYSNENIQNIYSRIEQLLDFPYLGKRIAELSDFPIRELSYNHYRIFYSVFENSNTIYIHFIIHHKRDFNSFYRTYKRCNL